MVHYEQVRPCTHSKTPWYNSIWSTVGAKEQRPLKEKEEPIPFPTTTTWDFHTCFFYIFFANFFFFFLISSYRKDTKDNFESFLRNTMHVHVHAYFLDTLTYFDDNGVFFSK